MTATHQLLTRDPATGGELIVTRLESPDGSLAIEGRFSLGWVGRLTPQQLDFLGLLLERRNNLQQLANDLGVAYNTAKARFDDVVAAVGGGVGGEMPLPPLAQPPPAPGLSRSDRSAILDDLASGTIDVSEALRRLRP